MSRTLTALLRTFSHSVPVLCVLLLLALAVPLCAAPVVSATIGPATLPLTGGVITVKATVTDSAGSAITSVTSQVKRSDGSYWNLTLSNGGSGTVYTSNLNIPGNNTSLAPYTYTATATATDALKLSTTAVATGQTVQANDSTPPTITPASISPATLLVTGGLITVTATVADPKSRAITSVTSQIKRTDGSYWNLTLSNGGSGTVYTGTQAITTSNTGSVAYTYTATVYATNDLKLSNSATASGQVVQANDTTPPTITGVGIGPATLPYTGGLITVSATVTDPKSRAITAVTSQIKRTDGSYWNVTLANGGSGNVYTGTLAISTSNTSSVPYTYTATVYANNDLKLSNSAVSSKQVVQANSGPPASLTPTLYMADAAHPTLKPAFATAGSLDLTLTINGANFTAGAAVLFNGVPLTPTSVTGSQVIVVIPEVLLTSPGAYAVSVVNPSPGGISNSVNFNVR